MRNSDFGGIFVAFVFGVVALFTVWQYVETKSDCSGIVVEDMMGMPTCVENPGVVVPTNRQGIR